MQHIFVQHIRSTRGERNNNNKYVSNVQHQQTCEKYMMWGCTSGGVYVPFLYKQREDVPLVEFMYLGFTRMPGESCCRWLRSSLCLCDALQALINSIVCWFFYWKVGGHWRGGMFPRLSQLWDTNILRIMWWRHAKCSATLSCWTRN